MITKILLASAFGAGYVLGARAGRERYEQIRRLAVRVKDDPYVHEALDSLVDHVVPDLSGTQPPMPGERTRIGQ
jgi:hypothetical protein